MTNTPKALIEEDKNAHEPKQEQKKSKTSKVHPKLISEKGLISKMSHSTRGFLTSLTQKTEKLQIQIDILMNAVFPKKPTSPIDEQKLQEESQKKADAKYEKAIKMDSLALLKNNCSTLGRSITQINKAETQEGLKKADKTSTEFSEKLKTIIDNINVARAKNKNKQFTKEDEQKIFSDLCSLNLEIKEELVHMAIEREIKETDKTFAKIEKSFDGKKYPKLLKFIKKMKKGLTAQCINQRQKLGTALESYGDELAIQRNGNAEDKTINAIKKVFFTAESAISSTINWQKENMKLRNKVTKNLMGDPKGILQGIISKYIDTKKYEEEKARAALAKGPEIMKPQEWDTSELDPGTIKEGISGLNLGQSTKPKAAPALTQNVEIEDEEHEDDVVLPLVDEEEDLPTPEPLANLEHELASEKLRDTAFIFNNHTIKQAKKFTLSSDLATSISEITKNNIIRKELKNPMGYAEKLDTVLQELIVKTEQEVLLFQILNKTAEKLEEEFGMQKTHNRAVYADDIAQFITSFHTVNANDTKSLKAKTDTLFKKLRKATHPSEKGKKVASVEDQNVKQIQQQLNLIMHKLKSVTFKDIEKKFQKKDK